MRLSLPSAAVLTLSLGGCATGNVAPPVTPAIVAASHGASPTTLENGRQIFTGRCTACHPAAPMDKHTSAQWRTIVADMSQRARLDEAQRTALLAYIEAARAQ